MIKRTKTIQVTEQMLDKAILDLSARPQGSLYCSQCLMGRAINRAMRYRVGDARVTVGYRRVGVAPKYGRSQSWELDNTGYKLRELFDARLFDKIRPILPTTVVLTRTGI